MPTSRRREVLGYLAGHPLATESLRRRLLGAAGVELEGYVEILSGLRIAGEGGIRIGDGCFLNHDCLIDAAADVVIGRKVALGNRVALLTSGHDFSAPELRAGARVLRPIVVGDGAWLGAGAVVLGGVTIGEGSVVAAGAVVVRDVPPHSLWAGVPAQHLRELPV
jgi:maltose O-acetyltransferase